MPEAAELIRRFADLWSGTFAAEVDPHACILASRTAVETFRYFGVDAEAVPVTVIVCNAVAFPLLQSEVPLADWPETAWSIGVGLGGTNPTGYEAHMVVRIPDVAWVDLTAGQFSRPQRGIPVPDVIWLEATNGTDGPGRQWRHAQLHDDAHYLWRELDDQSFRDAPDWRRNYRPFTARAIRALRA